MSEPWKSEPWKHHAKVVNGFRMHYVIAGSGYLLVLLHGWQHFPPHLRQHFFVVPRSIRHHVMERLMHATTILGSQAGSHRLDALALTRQ